MQIDVASIFAGMVEGLRSTGLKDSAIARGAHVSKSTISRYANGGGKQGSAEAFIKLSSFYEARTGAPPAIRSGRR